MMPPRTAHRLAALALAGALAGCSPQANLLMAMLPAGTTSILLSHLETVEDVNRAKVAELDARGDFEGLLKFAQENLAKQPNNTDWWLVAGYANSGLKRHADAAQCYTEVVRIEPDRAAGWHLLAQSYRAMKEPQRAISVLDRATLALRDSPVTYYMLGESYGDLARYDAAAQAYRQALKINPGFAQAWYGLGHAELRNGRIAEAEQAAQALQQLDPKLAAALSGAVKARR